MVRWIVKAAALAAVLVCLGSGSPIWAQEADEPGQPMLVDPDASNDIDPAASAIKQGDAHAEKGEYDEALKDYNEALHINPDSAWAYNARGCLYFNAGKLDLARNDFDRALALVPDFSEARYNSGLVYSAQGAFQKAIAEFDLVLGANPADADALIERGRAYAGLRNLDRAIADFSAAIAVAPDNSRAWTSRATAYLLTLQFKRALDDCDEALKRNPRDAWALFIRGSAQAALSEFALALKDLDAALAIDPKYVDALRARAMVYSITGQIERAIADLDAAIMLSPDDALLLTMRAGLHRRLHHRELAMADYERVLAMKPKDPASNAARLGLLVESGKADEAQAQCLKLIDEHPGEGWPYLACAEVKRQLGDDKAANQEVAKAEKLDPSLANAIPVLDVGKQSSRTPEYAASMLLGIRNMELGNYDEAADDLERAIKQGGSQAQLLPDLCAALSRTARLADAAYQCSRALQLNENSGPSLEARGYIYFQQGKFAEALADFSRAARIFPQNARYLYERGMAKLKTGDAAGGQKDIDAAEKMSADVAEKVPLKMRP